MNVLALLTPRFASFLVYTSHQIFFSLGNGVLFNCGMILQVYTKDSCGLSIFSFVFWNNFTYYRKAARMIQRTLVCQYFVIFALSFSFSICVCLHIIIFWTIWDRLPTSWPSVFFLGTRIFSYVSAVVQLSNSGNLTLLQYNSNLQSMFQFPEFFNNIFYRIFFLLLFFQQAP